MLLLSLTFSKDDSFLFNLHLEPEHNDDNVDWVGNNDDDKNNDDYNNDDDDDGDDYHM